MAALLMLYPLLMASIAATMDSLDHLKCFLGDLSTGGAEEARFL